jgi:hypothetical protein
MRLAADNILNLINDIRSADNAIQSEIHGHANTMVDWSVSEGTLKWCGIRNINIQRMMLDTGCAPFNLVPSTSNGDISNGKAASTTFQAAFGKTLGADVSGIMNATILGQDGYSTFVPIPVTSVPGLNQALGAYYWWYTLGYELHIDFDNPHMMHRINGHKIPLFFDPNHKAWYIVFCIGDKPVDEIERFEPKIKFRQNKAYNPNDNSTVEGSMSIFRRIAKRHAENNRANRPRGAKKSYLSYWFGDQKGQILAELNMLMNTQKVSSLAAAAAAAAAATTTATTTPAAAGGGDKDSADSIGRRRWRHQQRRGRREDEGSSNNSDSSNNNNSSSNGEDGRPCRRSSGRRQEQR